MTAEDGLRAEQQQRASRGIRLHDLLVWWSARQGGGVLRWIRHRRLLSGGERGQDVSRPKVSRATPGSVAAVSAWRRTARRCVSCSATRMARRQAPQSPHPFRRNRRILGSLQIDWVTSGNFGVSGEDACNISIQFFTITSLNKETMVHNGGSARQLEKCFAGHKNVVQNQETSDHNFSAQHGEKNSAAHKAGSKVFSKSLKQHNRDVALAAIASCDPKFKLDGAEIGNEFWLVHDDMAVMQ